MQQRFLDNNEGKTETSEETKTSVVSKERDVREGGVMDRETG
jgi:hypothetical protein